MWLDIEMIKGSLEIFVTSCTYLLIRIKLDNQKKSNNVLKHLVASTKVELFFWFLNGRPEIIIAGNSHFVLF